jgi:hypothetical protein
LQRHYARNETFHPCTVFGIISSVAVGVEQLRAKDELNDESVNELNLRIAQEMGFPPLLKNH